MPRVSRRCSMLFPWLGAFGGFLDTSTPFCLLWATEKHTSLAAKWVEGIFLPLSFSPDGHSVHHAAGCNASSNVSGRRPVRVRAWTLNSNLYCQGVGTLRTMICCLRHRRVVGKPICVLIVLRQWTGDGDGWIFCKRGTGGTRWGITWGTGRALYTVLCFHRLKRVQ